MELDITALDMLPAREEAGLAACQVSSFTCENEGNSCYVTR
ncbi:ALQxL family class IV lanthipeptide [Nonomuraea sp. NPDC001023]